MSGIAVKYILTVRNSRNVLDIVITPYFDPAESWMKERGKNAQVLAHEQTHFDIAAIKACELANLFRGAVFTEENYSHLVTELNDKINIAVDEEENRYDNETGHGTIEDKQLWWQNKITEQAKTIGCY